MILSAIGFLILVFYLLSSNSLTELQIKQLFSALLSIVIISMLWLPLSLLFLRDRQTIYKILILLTLFLVAVSSFFASYIVYNIKDKEHEFLKNSAFIGMFYLFLHTFFLDFIIWSSNVLW